MFKYLKSKKILIIIVIFVIILITISSKMFKWEIQVDKRYNNEYGGETINVMNSSKELNNKNYDTENIPFFDNKAPYIYREYRDENKNKRKYWYVSSTDKVRDGVVEFFKQYYLITSKDISTIDDNTFLKVRHNKYTVMVNIREYESSIEIYFDAYK